MKKTTTARKIAPRKGTSQRSAAPTAAGPTATNLDIYGAKTIPWSRTLKQLGGNTAGSYWLATTDPGGRPHVAAVGALWVDGKLYFTSGPRTRKSRNLAANRPSPPPAPPTAPDLVSPGTAIPV